MIIYRLSSGEYKKDLSGTGSRLYGGRWNSVGQYAIYTTEHISLAVLELLVHIKREKRPMDYHLVTLELPATIKPVLIKKEKLKHGWKDDIAYSQFIGDEFLKDESDLVLKVPSAIIDQENNLLINPTHADAGKIKIISTKLFEFDKRLYSKNE